MTNNQKDFLRNGGVAAAAALTSLTTGTLIEVGMEAVKASPSLLPEPTTFSQHLANNATGVGLLAAGVVGMITTFATGFVAVRAAGKVLGNGLLAIDDTIENIIERNRGSNRQLDMGTGEKTDKKPEMSI